MRTIQRLTLKGEKRAQQRKKARNAPSGSMAGQQKVLERARYYEGVPKALKPRVRVK